MSLSQQQVMESCVEQARALGVTLSHHYEVDKDVIVIRGRIGEVNRNLIVDRVEVENGNIGYRVSQLIGEIRRDFFGDGIYTTGSPVGEADLFRRKFREVSLELERYKGAVKKLAFDLEMAKSGNPSVLKHDEVRKVALEQAAEFLMDHGVITTGPELEQVCQQIRKLQVSEARV